MPFPWIAAAMLAGSAVQGVAAAKASGSQAKAAKSELALKEKIYNETTERFQPSYQMGQNAMQVVGHEMGLNDAPEGYAGMEMTPAAKYAMEQGIGDVQASAAGRGSLYSGETLEKKRFGIATSDRENQMNRLMSLVGMGQAAAGNQAAAGQNYAVGGGQAIQNYGDAKAAGAIGIGNAINSGIENGIGYYNYTNHLDGIS